MISTHGIITSPYAMTSTFNGTLDDEGCQVFYLKARLVTALFLCPIICLFGLLGNVMSIVVLRTLKMRISTKTYLVGMAISDAAKLINDSFYFIVILITHINAETGLVCYSFLYPYAHFLFNASSCTTAWLTVSVAYERFVLVCQPTASRISCSSYRARVTTGLVFLVSVIVSLPFLFRYRTILHYERTETNRTPIATPSSFLYRAQQQQQQQHQLQQQQLLLTPSTPMENGNVRTYSVNVTRFWQENNLLVEVYNWLHGSVRSLVPLLILCFMTFLIVRASKRTRIVLKRTLSAKQRVTLTLVSVIVLFVVCVSPDAILSTFFGFGYHEESHCVRGVREVTDLLLTLNSAANFVLYCSFNRGFRKTLSSTAVKNFALLKDFFLSSTCVKKCSSSSSSANAGTRGTHDPTDSRVTTVRPTSRGSLDAFENNKRTVFCMIDMRPKHNNLIKRQRKITTIDRCRIDTEGSHGRVHLESFTDVAEVRLIIKD